MPKRVSDLSPEAGGGPLLRPQLQALQDSPVAEQNIQFSLFSGGGGAANDNNMNGGAIFSQQAISQTTSTSDCLLVSHEHGKQFMRAEFGLRSDEACTESQAISLI